MASKWTPPPVLFGVIALGGTISNKNYQERDHPNQLSIQLVPPKARKSKQTLTDLRKTAIMDRTHRMPTRGQRNRVTLIKPGQLKTTQSVLDARLWLGDSEFTTLCSIDAPASKWDLGTAAGTDCHHDTESYEV